MAIVMSEYWKEALRNRTRGTKKYAPYTTPLRKLMRRMPGNLNNVSNIGVIFMLGFLPSLRGGGESV